MQSKVFDLVLKLATSFRSQVIFGLLFAFILPVSAQYAEDIFAQAHKKYGESKSITTKFVQKGSSVHGKLLLKRGNKFLIELPDRTIVCNGKTLWNYTPHEKKVVVNTYFESPDALSPEKLLQAFPVNYSPTLKKENRSNGESQYVLTLVPKEEKDIVGGLQKIQMKLIQRGMKLTEMEISDGTTTRGWTFSELKTDVDVSDSAFEFEVPKEVRVIDLR